MNEDLKTIHKSPGLMVKFRIGLLGYQNIGYAVLVLPAPLPLPPTASQ